jgi:uncharacterized membrane protein YfcA
VTDLAVILVGFVASFLVGVTSIGGVLVLPALVIALGLPAHGVIPAAMISFIVPSTIALVIVRRRGQLDLRASAALWGGAVPGALVGAVLLPWIPVALLLWAIAIMLAVSGVRVLSRAAVVTTGDGNVSSAVLAMAGLAVGAVSALTGTGGPITLMPILGWLGVGARRAVMLCQSITLPITIFASLGYAWSLRLDWRLIALLASSSVVGILLGIVVAPRVKVVALARLIGVLMAATSLLIAGRLLAS